MNILNALEKSAADRFSSLNPWKRAGLLFVFVWFFVGGIAHFYFANLEVKIVPHWFPDHEALVFISGIFELLGALGIIVRYTRPLAGLGLVLLTIAVTPANLYMLQTSDQFPTVPYWALAMRIPAQVLLLFCIWKTTNAARVARLVKLLLLR
jgi:uncharacterized membrane protein